MSRRRVVVLGGTGWLGRHVCAIFAERGYTVTAVARQPAEYPAGHDLICFDLVTGRAEVLAAILRGAEVVVNAVDSTNTRDGWVRTGEEHRQVNVEMVIRLLAALSSLPSRPRLVHLGTIHEYGPVAFGVSVGETHPVRPANPYAESKVAGSSAVLRATSGRSADGVVLRLANLCGPYPSPASFPGTLLRLLREAERTGAAPRVTIVEATRDFVDVRDVADAVFRAAHAQVLGQVINIGSGVGTRIRDLVELLAGVAGFEPSTVHIEQSFVDSFGGAWTRVDTTVARSLLRWTPRVELVDSLRDMWAADRDPGTT